MQAEELIRRKKALNLSNKLIAQYAELPLGTVQKIFSGETKKPRFETMYKIEQVLRFYESVAELGERKQNPEGGSSPIDNNLLRDPGVEYQVGTGAKKLPNPLAPTSSFEHKSEPAGSKREYTVEDYLALPDSARCELIDGKFYMMGAPSRLHQFLLAELWLLFRNCIEQHAGDRLCELWLSPCDVQLDNDNRTMVQPDLFIFCREEEDPARFHGAPVFALEILSPSTRAKDMTLKTWKYQNAGVKEYWIVDPENWKVYCYLFLEETQLNVTHFDSVIPLGISEGQCSIDLHALYERARAKF